MISNYAQFENKSRSLTSLKPDKNLAEDILGESVSREELVINAHDADFDAKFLDRV